MGLDTYSQAMELLGTVADRESAGEYFFNALGVLPDPDPVLRKMGEEASILSGLEADDQVTAMTMARKNRVLNHQNYCFKPGSLKNGSPTETEKLICDRLVKDLERLTMREVIADILEAPFHGFSPMEILWSAENGVWRVRDFVGKPQRWFGFDEKNKLLFKGEFGVEPRPVPEGKFVLVRHFASYENPYGLRLLSRCLWPVAFKKGGLTFYTRFLEKFGVPWTLGKAPSGATEKEMDKMAANLARMAQDAVAVVPHGASLETVTITPGTGEQHEAYIKRMDAAISKVLIGNTLTSEIGDRGSYAAAKTHKDVADEFAQSDRDMVVTAMNELAWIYTRLNAAPDVMAPLFSYEEAEDLDAAANLDKKLYDMGVRFNAKHFQNKYSLPADEFSVTDQPGPPHEFSAPSARANPYQEAIEQAVQRYAPEAAKAGEEFFSQVWKIIDKAESFEDMERGLATLMGGDTEADALADLLADLMFEANLMGRFAEAEKRRGHA